MMNFTRERLYGFGGSILFCLLLLLILLFTVLKTVIPQEEAGGVLVNFGNVYAAGGMDEPANRESDAPEQVQSNTPSVDRLVEDATISQNIEETVYMPDAKKQEEERKRKEQQQKEEEQRLATEAEQKRIREEERLRQNINNQVAGAFGAGSAVSLSQGTTTQGTGNQGSVRGNSDQGTNMGSGVYGEFSLTGRSLGSGGLPHPIYTAQEEGKIVVDITVDTKGNVIAPRIGRGTNIDDESMRNSAVEAAKKAKFNSIAGNANQSGTITYRYNLR